MGTVIISLGHLLGQVSPWQQAGAQLRMVPGLLFTNKPSPSRQEESTKYFNFTVSGKESRREAEHRYRVSVGNIPVGPAMVLLTLEAGGERQRGIEGSSRKGRGIWDAPETTVILSCFLQVNNLSQRDLAISINFWVPVRLNSVAVWDVSVVTPSQVLARLSSLSRARTHSASYLLSLTF